MQLYFGHIDPQTGDKSRATDDADGDGMNNLQEFKAGTDPKNANSAFRITSIAAAAGNTQISLQSVAGKTYRLEYRDDLVAGSWATLLDQVSGTGGTLQVIDAGAGGKSKRFYRFTLEP